MDPGLIMGCSAIVGNVLLGVGLYASWNRNGRSASKKYGELEATISNVVQKQDETIGKLDNLDKKVDIFQINYADVSGRIDERVHAAERDIRELKAK